MADSIDSADITLQVTKDVDDFKDALDAVRAANPEKGAPPKARIQESVMVLRCPGTIGKPGGGSTGQDQTGEPDPCCPAATLVCDQISASKTKCGYTNPGDGEYYLTRTEEHDVTISHPSAECDTTCTGSTVKTIDIDTCGESCGGPGYDIIGPSNSCGTDPGPAHFGPCGGFTCVGAYGGCSYLPGTSGTNPVIFTYCCPDACTGGEGTETGTVTITYSDIYTTALLIAATETDLPEYDDSFDDACLAVRDLSPDESSYSISRVRYKFTFAEPLEEECLIRWIERTYDSDGNPVSDNEMSELVLVGESETTVYELMEPDENGTVEVIYPIGACCTEGVCSTTDEETCTEGGGTFQGECCREVCCDPDPC